jgi:1,4-alpha-glucan branching enzyme
MKTASKHRLACVLLVVGAAVAAFPSCGGPPPAPPSGGPEAVEGGVLFKYRNSNAKKVNLVGDFNDWSPTADPMSDENSDGEFTLFYPLGVGTYAYKFLVDGKNWVSDPANPSSEPDGFNGRNSIVKVIPKGS